MHMFSISPFTSLVCIPIRIMGIVIRLEICAITGAIKKYKSVIKKKKKSMIK